MAIRVTVASTGVYIFQSNSTIDTYGYLYNSSFSPSMPTANLLVSDDDSAGNLQFRLVGALQSTGVAVLVVTSYSSGITGSVTIIVNGPSAATFGLLASPTSSATPTASTVRARKRVRRAARAKTRKYCWTFD